MTLRKLGLGASLGAISVLVLGLGLAWACTPTSSVILLPETGAVGSKMTVTGQVAPDQGVAAPVEIRWNSVSGLLIGTVHPDANRNFSIEVTVPEGPAGVYYVLAISGKAEAGRAAYEVVQSPGSASVEQGPAHIRSVSSDLWSGLAMQNEAVSTSVPPDAVATSGRLTGTAVSGFALLAMGLSALAGHLVLRAHTGRKAGL